MTLGPIIAHPDTAALLACMPRYRSGRERQAGIEGNVPRITNWFDGCRFAPRCTRVQDACRSLTIPFAETRPGQEAKCLFPL